MGQPFQYGGQAVIEGVMMRGPKEMAVAVRKPAGDIVLETKPINSWAQKYPFLKWPLIRGVWNLFEALVLGIQVLTQSANLAMDEEEEALTAKEIALTIFLSVGLAILLFIVIPTVGAYLTRTFFSPFWQNLAEGLLRITIFLGYVIAISSMNDIKRVFQYHGAEHKVIHTYESGEELTVENAKKYTTLHPRCGTSFIIIVLVLTIFIYSVLHVPNIWYRLLSRIVLLPLIAGISYELLKWTSRHTSHGLIKILIAPGLWVQKLTTREPDDSQLEVAITALQAVLPQEKKEPSTATVN